MASRERFADLMRDLMIAYPNLRRVDDPKERAAMIEVYYRILGDLPDELLEAAVNHVAANNTFFPAAAELRKAAMALAERAAGLPCAGDAWAEVCRSFGTNGYYRGAPEWSDPLIGKAIAAIGGYASLCVSENPVADRARFLQAYDVYLERGRTDRALLPGVRRAVAALGAGERKMMEGR